MNSGFVRNSRRHSYNSPLRERNANATREQIIAAFAEQLTDAGLENFSVARVADRAGVAVQTVYHHFPNRETLQAALDDWVETHISSADIASLQPSPENLTAFSRLVLRNVKQHEAFFRALQASNVGRRYRSESRLRVRQVHEQIIRSISGDLNESLVQRAVSILHCLISSATWMSLKDESGLTDEDCEAAVSWTVEVLVEEIRRLNKAAHSEEC
ncbi:MAG TPA: TetR/AcrR family transcriptional regulator [Dehalococcoidia bacterium]|nr:TetR/AcrR family transcriptional regulator [Dehalococcoidia bacterium]